MHFFGRPTLPPLYGRGSKVTILVDVLWFWSQPIPKYVFLNSIFNVFTWLWRRQSQILTPIWTGKQSDDFGRSMLPFQRAFKKTGPTRGTKPIPKYVFLHADSIFNVFTWLWRRQSQILTPIWTGKQSDDFGRSPFSIRNVAFPKSVQKKLDWTFLLEIGDLTFLAGLPYPHQKTFYDSGPTKAQNLSQSMFSCMLIPFSMFLLDSDEGKVKYSPLYGRGSKVTILVGRHFQSGIKERSKKTWLGHIFVRNWRPNQKCTFFCRPTLPPSEDVLWFWSHEGTKPIPKYCMLIPFSIFTWLWRRQSQILTYGRGSKVTILVGRVAFPKSVQKNLIGTHWLGQPKVHFFVPYPPQKTFYDSGRPNQKCTFFWTGRPTLPPSEDVLWFCRPTLPPSEDWSHERHKTYPKVCFLACWFHFQCFYLTLTKAKSNTHPYMDGEAKWRFW